MINIEQTNLNNIINNYAFNHEKYGYGPRSLEMSSDRRNIRYFELIKNFQFFEFPNQKFRILDIGCGYGDLILYLDYLGLTYSYIGIDLCKPFLEYDKEKFANRDNVEFIYADFFDYTFEDIEFDYAVFSQTFNNKYSNEPDNIDLIKKVVKTAFIKADKGVSFNFVTNKVQFKKDNVAYHSVEELISFAYSLTNSVILDNSCMPYEATLYMFNDHSSDGMVYDSFRFKHDKDFKNGNFVIIKKETN